MSEFPLEMLLHPLLWLRRYYCGLLHRLLFPSVHQQQFCSPFVLTWHKTCICLIWLLCVSTPLCAIYLVSYTVCPWYCYKNQNKRSLVSKFILHISQIGHPQWINTGCPKSHAPSLTRYILKFGNNIAIKEICLNRVSLHNFLTPNMTPLMTS